MSTHKDIQKAFEKLAGVCGRSTEPYAVENGKTTGRIGAWHVEDSGQSGQRYSISQVVNEGGGVMEPLGNGKKMTAGEFVGFCQSASLLIEQLS